MLPLTAGIIFALNSHACTCAEWHCPFRPWRVTLHGISSARLADGVYCRSYVFLIIYNSTEVSNKIYRDLWGLDHAVIDEFGPTACEATSMGEWFKHAETLSSKVTRSMDPLTQRYEPEDQNINTKKLKPYCHSAKAPTSTCTHMYVHITALPSNSH